MLPILKLRRSSLKTYTSLSRKTKTFSSFTKLSMHQIVCFFLLACQIENVYKAKYSPCIGKCLRVHKHDHRFVQLAFTNTHTNWQISHGVFLMYNTQHGTGLSTIISMYYATATEIITTELGLNPPYMTYPTVYGRISLSRVEGRVRLFLRKEVLQHKHLAHRYH